jgi:hypothetical protein
MIQNCCGRKPSSAAVGGCRERRDLRVNPATHERLGSVPAMGPPRRATPSRRRTRPSRLGGPHRQGRAAILRRWYELLLANQDDLAS